MTRRLPRKWYQYPNSRLEAMLSDFSEEDQEKVETELELREHELETFGTPEKDQLDYPHNEGEAE